MSRTISLCVAALFAAFTLPPRLHAQSANVKTPNKNQSVKFKSAIFKGSGNLIQSNSLASFIGGGQSNKVSLEITNAVIGGGFGNTVGGHFGVVAGGLANTNTGDFVVIGGGNRNVASGALSTVGGGTGNRANYFNATVAGGAYNQATTNAFPGLFGGATVGGGYSNTASGEGATVGGGQFGKATKDGATVGGGLRNVSDAFAATVVGGYANTNVGVGCTIGGGQSNTIEASATNSVIGGGRKNASSNNSTTISGGNNNATIDAAATVAGGTGNSAAYYASVGGGQDNTAGGWFSTVPGGARCAAIHNGAFVWSGAWNVDTKSTTDRSFTVRASGGVRFITTLATNGLDIGGSGNGVAVAPGGTAWTTLSDSNAKTAVRTVDSRAVLSKLSRMPVTEWEYKHDPHRRYFGPMAQDFHAAFGLGDDDRTINTLDADGVLFLSVKGLVEELKERDRAIEELKAQNAAFGSQLRAIQERLGRVAPSP